MTKNEILNSDWGVRRSAAGNPNTPGYKETTYDFVVTKNYVAVKGTNHMWYKHNYPKLLLFILVDVSAVQENNFSLESIRLII